ncbi:hypothetical protein ACFLZJ_01375 [Nanoarchaeota archaeon]
MRLEGLPFVWQNHYGHAKGIAVSILGNYFRDKTKGLSLAGLTNWSDGEFKGVSLAGLTNFIANSSKGLSVAGLFNGYTKENISDKILNNKKPRSRIGIDISLLGNYISGPSKGLSISGGYNHAGVSNRYLIQASLFGNNISSVNTEDFVLQIGLYNKAGNHLSPLINVTGLRNLPRLFGGNNK